MKLPTAMNCAYIYKKFYCFFTWKAAGTSALFIILKLLAANLPDSTTPMSRWSHSRKTSGPVEYKITTTYNTLTIWKQHCQQ